VDGDGTEIPTDEGKLYVDSVLYMGSRRIVGFSLASITTPTWPKRLCRWRSRSVAASPP
jgi:hypothetical protein